MLAPVFLRRNRQIRQEWQLRSHLLAAERLAAFLASVTAADYRTAFDMAAALPRTEVIRQLRKARLETRRRRLGPFAGVVRHGRLRLLCPPGAPVPETFGPAMSGRVKAPLPARSTPCFPEGGTRPTAPSCPGEAEARAYLLRVTRPRDRKLEALLARAAGTGDAGHCVWPSPPSPDQAIGALMILQLAQALADAGLDIARLPPAPGTITAITLPRFDHRKRLAGLFPDIYPKSAVPAVLIEADPASRGRVEEFHLNVESELLNGHGVVALLSGVNRLPDTFQPLVWANVQLPSLSTEMVTRLFRILHPGGAIAPELLEADSASARLGYTHLLPALAARDAQTAQDQLRRTIAAMTLGADTTLEAVHGQPAAVAALRQAVCDLQDWQAGRINWSDVTQSFLLYGPPGTGKTLLAQALAGSARVPLIRTSYSECQKMGHQGDMLRALYTVGEQAIARAPSVFFIDEIDSFFARDRPGNGYIIGVVNGLLTLIDRVRATPGVILIAATNERARVDAAIIRAGRFDRHIPVGLPDRGGIRAMLQAGLPAPLLQDTAHDLADQLLGLSGAEIAAMLRDARTRARAARRALSREDVLAAADAAAPRPDPDMLWQIAVHEAGHLLAGHLLGLAPPVQARITARGGFVARPLEGMLTHATIPLHLQMKLAGRAAEALLCGDISSGGGAGANSDLAQATQLALEAEANFGFGPLLAWHALDRPLVDMPPDVRARVEKRLQHAERDVRSLLDPHRTDLRRIATALAAARDLDAADLERLLESVSHPASHKRADCEVSP